LADPASEAPRPGGSRSKSARLAFMADTVNRDGAVTVEVLANQLEVSRMTVHRDLDELQRRGVLRKVRGGASAHRSAQFESDLPFRSMSAVREKQAMARTAAVLASEGDVVIVDDSTTALEVVPHLVRRAPITVITNFLLVIQAVEGRPDTSLIALGGEYIPRYRAFLGRVCELALYELYADVLFASSSALQGLDVYHQDQRVVAVKRAMMRASRRRVLMMDHTKIGHGALHRLGSVAEFTHVVVDAEVDDATVKGLSDAGVEVLVAPSS